ncbi:MAG: hypothetical protein KKH28_05895 [Elusimicrobia bacterium]|nr:hypothetical protein [Elusimicrobiota bacterium]
MKKTFDAVAFMRLRREEIDREDAGLTWKQKRERTRQTLEKDPLWQRLRERGVQPAPPGIMTAREKTETDYGKSNG